VDWAARAIPSQFFSSAFVSDGIWNSAHWRNPTFDRLARQYDATLDVQSRTSIAEQMATIQRDEVPAVIAYWIDAARAMRKPVRGVQPDGASFLDLTGAWLTSA
jgi:peptide/nickel transport system substrate-binding protein